MTDKTTVGLIERVTVHGKTGKRRLLARIDTGATKSSIDAALARELKLGPCHRHTTVKTSEGKSVRPVIKESIEIKGRRIRAFFTIADRRHMRYKVLIGQNILKRSFLIDPAQH